MDEQSRFFRLVEQFTPSHLRLMSFLSDPSGTFERLGILRTDYLSGAQRVPLEQTHPEFAGQREWYDLLDTDLANAQLIHPNLRAKRGP